MVLITKPCTIDIKKELSIYNIKSVRDLLINLVGFKNTPLNVIPPFKTAFFGILCLTFQLSWCQHDINIKMHSHNDYHQNVPFWKALSLGFNSIEADILLKNDTIFVAHEASEIISKRNVENLYIQPIQKMIRLGFGVNQTLQLLIDIKTETKATLTKLIDVVEKYPEIIKNKNISIVISGNRPKVSQYVHFPDFISFDHQSLVGVADQLTWDKVALISLNFKKYSRWDGRQPLTDEEYDSISSIIDKAHSLGKPFRFWGIPDSSISWETFYEMGLDFINTDDPVGLSNFMNKISKR